MSRKLSRVKTQKRHKLLTCKVYEVKIDSSTLSIESLKHLKSLFIQSKYLYNHILNQPDVFHIDTKIKNVPVKCGDHFEDRSLNYISSQMKQAIHQRLIQNIINLSKSKDKGIKVGKLDFISKMNSVPLKQYQITYKIDFKKNRIKIQGLKQHLKVYGLEQIPLNIEITNATLLQKPSGFYLNITTFQHIPKISPPEQSIGIDFGCQTQLTLSNGIKIEYQVPISKQLKRLDRKIMKKDRPKSHNKYKDQLKRQREYESICNKKKDIQRKVVSVLTKNYKYIVFQDESLNAWKASNHGKKIQHSGIGGILYSLKHKAYTPIEVNKFYPSTQLCPECNHKQKMPQEVRTYVCENCGYTKDRDWKSAICIENEGFRNLVLAERKEVKPVETESSTYEVFKLLSQINGVKISLASSVVDAGNLTACQ